MYNKIWWKLCVTSCTMYLSFDVNVHGNGCSSLKSSIAKLISISRISSALLWSSSLKRVQQLASSGSYLAVKLSTYNLGQHRYYLYIRKQIVTIKSFIFCKFNRRILTINATLFYLIFGVLVSIFYCISKMKILRDD